MGANAHSVCGISQPGSRCSLWSDLAGFAYHFWHGAAFGAIFLALTGGRSIALPVLYGIAIGVGFLLSPVVQSLGVGVFGRDFGWTFAATVLSAHAAFGATLGLLLGRPVSARGAVSRWSPSGLLRARSAVARQARSAICSTGLPQTSTEATE